MNQRQHIFIPVGLLLLQFGILLGWPSLSYAAMLVAPLLCAAALWLRSNREMPALRGGWRLLALSMLVWAAGSFGNLWFEWVLGYRLGMYRSAMLMFQLAPVPVAYLLASEPHASGRRLVRLIDAALCLALCYSFFLLTWDLLTARGTPDDAGIQTMVWLIDAQSLFVTLGALIRLRVTQEPTERALFMAIAAFESIYMLMDGINNHFIAPREDLGPVWSSIISIAFAVTAGIALYRGALPARHNVDPMRLRTVRSASPIIVAGTLIAVSLFLIRSDYAMGAAGVVFGVIGYALRNTLTHVRQLARGDRLERRQIELQALAWTDALTGAANRHYLEHALRETWRRGPPDGRLVTTLMLDIDHFKGLNDRLGHGAGDACLRLVARALQDCLSRPVDLLARYGGEEFIALLVDTDGLGGQAVAERMRTAVEQLKIANPGSGHGHVTISIGCATGRLISADSSQGLIEAADLALYRAKSGGRNRVAA